MSGDKDYPNGHPQLAQVAIQQGNLLAENLIRIQKGKKLKPFRYRNLGSMATVGRNKAVAEFSSLKTQGWIAWFLWLVVHLRSILGVRNHSRRKKQAQRPLQLDVELHDLRPFAPPHPLPAQGARGYRARKA